MKTTDPLLSAPGYDALCDALQELYPALRDYADETGKDVPYIASLLARRAATAVSEQGDMRHGRYYLVFFLWRRAQGHGDSAEDFDLEAANVDLDDWADGSDYGELVTGYSHVFERAAEMAAEAHDTEPGAIPDMSGATLAARGAKQRSNLYRRDTESIKLNVQYEYAGATWWAQMVISMADR